MQIEEKVGRAARWIVRDTVSYRLFGLSIPYFLLPRPLRKSSRVCVQVLADKREKEMDQSVGSSQPAAATGEYTCVH